MPFDPNGASAPKAISVPPPPATTVTAPAPPPVATQAGSAPGAIPPVGPSPEAVAAAPMRPAPAQPAVHPAVGQQAHHAAIGKAVRNIASAIFGTPTVDYQINPQSGKTVQVVSKPRPGDIWRHMLAGILIGGAAGASAPVGQRSSFLGGFARGGEATREEMIAADERKRQAARQEFENMNRVKMTQATVALQNAQVAKDYFDAIGTNYETHEKLAKQGQANLDPYLFVTHADDKGKVVKEPSSVDYVVRNVTPQQYQDIIKRNPEAAAWDWEMTGVKVSKYDDKGNPVNFDFKLSAIDTKNLPEVSLTQDYADDLNNYLPEAGGRFKAGQTYDTLHFSSLKRQLNEAKATALAREKEQADIKEKRAGAHALLADVKEKASATALNRVKAQVELAKGKESKENLKTSQLLATAMQDLDKSNGDISKLKPSSRYLIGQNAMKLAGDASAEAKSLLAANPGDEDAQQKAQQLFDEAEYWRNLARSPFSGGNQNTPQNAPPTQKQVPTGMVKVLAPDGTPGAVPAHQLDKFLKDHPGSRRADVPETNQVQAGYPQVNRFNP